MQELGLRRDPEVFLSFLLLLPLLLLVALRLPATPSGLAPAAVATDEEQREDHEQRQGQNDSQANGVVDALLVLGQDCVPEVLEEGPDLGHDHG